MSLKSFTGLLTIGATVYDVSANLRKRGLRITGQVIFDIDNSKFMPINFIIDETGVAFSSPADFFFIDGGGDSIKVFAIDPADTTLDLDFENIFIAAAPIEINNVEDLLDLNLSVVAEAEDFGGFDDENAAITVLTRSEILPIRVNEIGNQFDHFGGLVSLDRLPKERNISYRDRIRSVTGKRAASSLNGLLYGITRELGLEIEKSIRVRIRDNPLNDMAEIRLWINEERIVLYSFWVPLEIQEEGQVPIVERETDLLGMTMGKLVDWINESDNFTAELLGESETDASFLFPNDSIWLQKETLPAQEIIPLKYSNIIPGALVIAEQPELEREVTGTPLTNGQFSIDYERGIITSFLQPSVKPQIAYLANRENFVLESSPIKLTAVTSEGGQDIYFDQITKEFFNNEISHYVNGLPTNEGYRILRGLLEAGNFPQFWGN